MIPGAQIGGGANTSAYAGIAMPRGVISGTEVEGGMVTCACTRIAESGGVILGVDLIVGGAMFAVEGVLGFVHFSDCSPPRYGSL